MTEIFKAAIERGASDIHIKTGDVIRARIHGQLTPLTKERMSADQVRALAKKLVPYERDRERIDEITDYDCSWGLSGLGRFRVNVLRQRGTLMIILRVIPFEAPTLEDLGLPSVLEKIAEREHGLILVTGVTGSGKSSTLAGIVEHINRNMAKHIVTLENPVEFLHRDKKSSITQRDVGTDTASFATGLRAALRQDPDVILIGEMRDTEAIDTALKAAETGHLVISTVHTQDAAQTLSRLVAVFDKSEQEMARIRLSESLEAVISQRLLPRADGQGRVVACEVMVVTGTVRDCIRDQDRAREIPELIEEGRDQYGSQSFDQHLLELVREKVVTFPVAKAAATNPSDFDLKVNFLGEGAKAVKEGAEGGSDGGDAPADPNQLFG